MDAPTTEPPASGSDPAGPPPPAPATPRRLVRRLDERLLGGVAGGVADALGIDVVLVRLAFVVSAFFGGLGVLVYVLAWVLLPAAPSTTATAPPADRRQLLGYALVALGLLAVGGRLGWSFKGDGAFWPLALIGLGAAVLWLRTRDDADTPPPAPPSAPAPSPPPSPAAASGADAPAATLPMKPPSPPAPRSYLGAVTTSLVLVLVGCAWVLDASGAIELDLGVLAALTLALVGAALVISAWWGRARGLIALGIPLVLLVGLFGLVDVPLRGGIGDPTYHPRSTVAVHRDYELAIGNLSVDLRDVEFSGVSRHLHAQLGVGQLNVTVPTGVRVVLDAHAGIGGVTAFGDSAHECCPTDVHRVVAGTPGGGTLYLDADVGAGHVDIHRREESLRATS